MADIPVHSLPDVTPAPTDRQMVVQADDELGLTPAVSAADVDGKVSKSGDTMTGPLSVPDLTASGNIEAASSAPKLTLNETDQAADAGAWKVQASAGTLKISSATDAGSQQTAFIAIDRSAGSLDMTGASSVSVPALTASGDVTIQGTTFPRLTLQQNSGGNAALVFKESGGTNRGLLTGSETGRISMEMRDAGGVARGSAWSAGVNGTSPYLTVPAAADGDTDTAARTTDFDSATGQVQVNGVEVGDTGPRADSTALLNGWTGSDTIIQRVGNIVTVALVSLDGTSNTGTAVYPLPAGFRPANSNYARIALVDAAAGLYRSYETANALNITTVSASVGGNPTTDITAMRATWTFPTDDAWPATLPGTPA